MKNKVILLIICGGIAAYKSLELIRLAKKQGAIVRCVLTKSAQKFITPMSTSALSEETTYTDLWSLKDETEMGHIKLSREADIIVVAPASANTLAKTAHGLADDLASTILLASNKPILVAPAMNHMMWSAPATQDNISCLQKRGVNFIGPEQGEMACQETGIGRMSEPEDVLKAIQKTLQNKHSQTNLENNLDIMPSAELKNKIALVTSGPTYEPIDPVRFIGNRSSGKQGHAIADQLEKAGAKVFLVHGPVNIPTPQNIHATAITSAEEMHKECQKILSEHNVDIAVCAAAVSDWKVINQSMQKMKKNAQDKNNTKAEHTLKLEENPDILKDIAQNHTQNNKDQKQRPEIVIGFAAETENTLENAKTKLHTKGCDFIIANTVGHQKTFGSDENHVMVISSKTQKVLEWPPMTKKQIAKNIVSLITDYLNPQTTQNKSIELPNDTEQFQAAE